MIFFKGTTEDGKGINFQPLESMTVVVKIIDGYTGLCSYWSEIFVSGGYQYFFSHPVGIRHRRFEVWDEKEETVYLKIDLLDPSSKDLREVDVFGSLKDLKYYNESDRDPALPLYEIFCTEIYDRGQECCVKDGDVVFDIGGNLGLFSYYSICKGADKVYCFEPSPTSYSCIEENFNFPNLFIEESAVSSTHGEISFYLNPNNSINSSANIRNEGCEEITCKSINLFTYIRENNIPKIDYLKLDCEGAEYEIIDSIGEDYLSNSIRNICLEYHLNKDGRILPMIDKLKKCGFEIEFEHSSDQINNEIGIFYAYKK
jgi:FkbM family methyltransferase